MFARSVGVKSQCAFAGLNVLCTVFVSFCFFAALLLLLLGVRHRKESFFLSTAESECTTDVDNSDNAKKQQPKNNNNNQYRIFWRGKVKRATFVPCPPLLMAITSSCLLPAELVTTVHGALLFTWPLDEGNLLLVGSKVGCMRCFI